MWPDRRLLDLIGIETPIVQAPMANVPYADLVIGACEGGALGSLACAMLSPEKAREQMLVIRQRTSAPVNMNFFCHEPAAPDADREAAWRMRLAPYYRDLGLDLEATVPAANRAPFDAAMCAVVEEVKPEVVSFHFGLPQPALLERVKAVGSTVMACATTVQEAVWLEQHGADVVIAQGSEAGGHRGMFLTQNLATQAGTFALVPQVVDAVGVPVVAAGGIADGRGIAAALALGAAGAVVGTAYLSCPEARLSPLYLEALAKADDQATVITNVITGRPARGIANRVIREVGPIAPEAPAFPHAVTALIPLRAAAEARGRDDFTPLWAGQAAALSRIMPAADLTRHLAAAAAERLTQLAGK
ncbi:MAG: nitronate monooxygenase [Xanthobacteraceae bacterium]|nr:MAG: nitronate monooxygenase [Xanthobacteraceae bacterium]